MRHFKELSRNEKIIVSSAVAGGVIFSGYALSNAGKDKIPSTADITTAVVQTASDTAALTNLPEAVTEAITSITETQVVVTVIETQAPTVPATVATQPTNSVSTAPKENHFNDYDNPGQQDTKEYVLNTARLVIHKPSCHHVEKIAEENYSTTADFNWAINQGYKPCKVCNPF